MGFFDLFKIKENKPNVQSPTTTASEPVVPESEKKYYQPDSYYTDVVHEGTPFEYRIISFEERKKTAIPSTRGLYPAEILLLEYCSHGTYPSPKNGYPGFWWFTYGIRNVGAALKSLENRGYISFSSPSAALNGLTVTQLKEILSTIGQATTGKKAELIERISETVLANDLLAMGVQPKYALTNLGQLELSENEYVPYMHGAPNKTIETDLCGTMFNVWSINKLLGSGDKSNWRAIVYEQEAKINQERTEANIAFMNNLKKTNHESYKKLKAQDDQLAAVQKASEKYRVNKDLDAYIAFWEVLWSNGGLFFEGSKWHFELPDLYIKAKRYDDALNFVEKLKRSKPIYADKADAYATKIIALNKKQLKKN